MVDAFDAEQWVLRMGEELARIAYNADPCFFPQNVPPPWGATEDQITEHEKRQYRDLACAARHDETAAKLFARSSLRLKDDPQDARSVLHEHPLLRPGLTDCAGVESIGFPVLIRWFPVTLDQLIANLAKVAVRDGGESAARCLHTFLVAADGAGVPGYEIIVIHGLDLDRRFELGPEAFLDAVPVSQETVRPSGRRRRRVLVRPTGIEAQSKCGPACGVCQADEVQARDTSGDGWGGVAGTGGVVRVS